MDFSPQELAIIYSSVDFYKKYFATHYPEEMFLLSEIGDLLQKMEDEEPVLEQLSVARKAAVAYERSGLPFEEFAKDMAEKQIFVKKLM